MSYQMLLNFKSREAENKIVHRHGIQWSGSHRKYLHGQYMKY